MSARFRLLFPAACLFLAVTLAAGCGRKTDPLTPDSTRPDAVRDVTVAVRDTVAFLTWRAPTKNSEGKDLAPAALRGFRIYRAETGRDRKKFRYKPLLELTLAGPAPAEVRDGVVFWNDTGLRYDRVYAYRIRAVGALGDVGAWSDEVIAAPLVSIAAPKGLAAEGGDGRVALTWEPVATRADGSRHDGFVGYNVYRRSDKGRYDDVPLNKEPLRATLYSDTAVENNATYWYRVRAVDSPVKPWRESLDSAEASARPRDVTPPARPTGLTVVPGVAMVFLTWNENKERDFSGYLVYRSIRSGADYERLTDKPLTRTTFSDEGLKGGAAYYYVITAVDQSGNESERSDEKKAVVERKR